MYLTAKVKIAEESDALKDVGNICTKIWNKANYYCREEWDKTGNIPSYYELQRVFKDDFWCRKLHSHTAQAVLHKLAESYRSWYKLRKTDTEAHPPGFRKKNSISTVTFSNFAIRVEDHRLRLTLVKGTHLWLDYQAQHGVEITQENVIRVEVTNSYANIVYKVQEPALKEEGQVMAIDLGIINTATTVNEDGDAKIYSGKEILSIQRYFNKEIAKQQRIVTNQSKVKETEEETEIDKKSKNKPKNWSRKLSELSRKRTRQIKHVLHAQTRAIVEDCKHSNVKTVVTGDLRNIRKGKKWNKKSNQKLHAWSFSRFTALLSYKLALEGIQIVTVNEKSTSQTCSKCGYNHRYNRKKRGWFKCRECGYELNADVNGAKNILDRYLHQIGKTIEGSSGIVDVPRVIRWDMNILSEPDALQFIGG